MFGVRLLLQRSGCCQLHNFSCTCRAGVSASIWRQQRCVWSVSGHEPALRWRLRTALNAGVRVTDASFRGSDPCVWRCQHAGLRSCLDASLWRLWRRCSPARCPANRAGLHAADRQHACLVAVHCKCTRASEQELGFVTAAPAVPGDCRQLADADCGAGFGQQPQQQQPQGRGTRVAPWQRTAEKEGTAGNQQTVQFMTITSMPQYRGKSVEELRWEDYQVWPLSAAAAPGRLQHCQKLVRLCRTACLCKLLLLLQMQLGARMAGPAVCNLQSSH